MSKGFSGAYCAECEDWKQTSVPSPAHNGVHVCAECFAPREYGRSILGALQAEIVVLESVLAALQDKVKEA